MATVSPSIYNTGMHFQSFPSNEKAVPYLNGINDPILSEKSGYFASAGKGKYPIRNSIGSGPYIHVQHT